MRTSFLLFSAVALTFAAGCEDTSHTDHDMAVADGDAGATAMDGHTMETAAGDAVTGDAAATDAAGDATHTDGMAMDGAHMDGPKMDM